MNAVANATVWALLGASCLLSFCTIALSVVNRDASEAARAVYRQQGIAGMSSACLLAVTSLVVVLAWTVFAFAFGDWRFATIAWIPLVAGRISKAATKSRRLETS